MRLRAERELPRMNTDEAQMHTDGKTIFCHRLTQINIGSVDL